MNKQDIESIDTIIKKAQATLLEKNIQCEAAFAEIKNYCPNENIHSLVDLTYLKANGGEEQIINLCNNAKKLNTKTVCVNSINIELAIEQLKNTTIKVICVEGFPLGATELQTLIFASNNAFKSGVAEVDIVFPQKFIADKDYQGALNYLLEFRRQVQGIIKVIFETSEHNKEEIAIMSFICKLSNMDFIKTSTGFSTAGATLFDVALMRRIVGANIGVKASGGIKTTSEALSFIEHGANRIGTSGLGENNAGY